MKAPSLNAPDPMLLAAAGVGGLRWNLVPDDSAPKGLPGVPADFVAWAGVPLSPDSDLRK
jgi:hypothetical protein